VWLPALAAAELEPPPRIHDLRHTAVSLWIAAGASPKEVAARVGHTSVRVVLDVYGHLWPEQDQALAARLDQMIGDVGPSGRGSETR
jgi:integrase